MATRVLSHPGGEYSRGGVPALSDAVRGALLRVLPAPLDAPDPLPAHPTPAQVRRREWHQVACGFGDLLEIIAGYVIAALVSAGVFTSVVVALLLIGSWQVWAGAAAAVIAALAVWRLVVIIGRIHRIQAEINGYLDMRESLR